MFHLIILIFCSPLKVMALSTNVLLAKAEFFICTMCRFSNLNDAFLMRVVACAAEYLTRFRVKRHAYTGFLTHHTDRILNSLWRYDKVVRAFFFFTAKRKVE